MDEQLVLAGAPVALLSLLLFLFSMLDLAGRPRDRVAGPKIAWGVVLIVVMVGPIVYLWFGRKEGRRDRR